MKNGNGIRYHKIRIVLLGFLAIAAFAVWAPGAYAFSSYKSSFLTKYGITAGTKLDTCGTCHVGNNTGQWNPYGQAIRSRIGTGIDAALTAVEPLDSDGDGFSNLVEINARTFPGDPNDFPQPVNRAPAAVNDSYSVNAGATLTVSAPGVLGNDSDPDGNPITAVLASSPSSGTFNLNSNGSFTYTPTISSGTVTFTYRASDGSLTSNLATVTITVNAVNRAPAAVNDSYSVNAGATLTVSAPGVLGNDSDPDGNPITAVLASSPSSGTFNLNSNGSFTYTPTISSGTVTFTYRASDGSLTSNLATVTITVNAQANRAPVLSSIGNKTVDEGSLLSFTATATDPDAGQTLTFSLASGAPAGASITAGGAFTWTPTEAQGPGSFPITIRVTDNGSPALSVSETITVTVNEVNVAPVLATIGNKTGTVGSPVTFTATATDADIPAQTRTFSLGAGAPSGATINGSTGAFSWTPSADGSFPVTVIVTDNGTPPLNDTEAITITVSAQPNRAPVAANNSYSTPAGTALTVPAPGVLGNDSDPDNNPLTAVLASGTGSGTLNLNANGSFTYMPNANFSGQDSFTYRANDGTSDSNTATVTIMVNPDTPPPSGEISTMPGDNAIDVPVTTVVTTSVDGSADIANVVNENTFALMVNSPVALTSSGERGDDHYECVHDGIVNGSITYNDSHTTATFTPLCKLAYGTTYTAMIVPVAGLQQSVLAEPMSWSFTTIAQTPDSDDDGVEDGEDDHPRDKKKATPPSSRGKGKFLIDITGEPTASLASVEGVSDASMEFNQKGKPVGFEFVDGMVRYTVEGVTPGGTITVKVTFPSGIPKGSKVYKADGNGFMEFPGAVVSGSTVTLTLTDGGTGDADGLVNGVIVDPVGVAVPAASGGGSIEVSTGASGGGGCSVAGAGGGWKEAAGSYGLLVLAWLGLALRRMKPRAGK